MGKCIITYKGQKYSEEQFKEYFINNKQEFATSIAKNKDIIDSFKRKMEGIDFVFSQSPELASIGNKAQYLQYLSTIFKTSKVKDIVYHGTKEQFEVFEVPFYAEDMYGKDAPIGVFFSTDRQYTSNFGNINIPAILNLKNPKFEKEIEYEKVAGFRLGKKITEFDGFYGNDKIDLRDAKPSKGTEYVVFEPEQIHLLGSKQDIESFSNFVKNSKVGNTENMQNYMNSKSVDYIMEKLIQYGKIEKRC